MSMVSMEMKEVMEDGRKFRLLATYSDELLKSANRAIVLHEKSKVLLEECIKELQYLQRIINDERPEAVAALEKDFQVSDAKSDSNKDKKTKNRVSK